VQLYLGDTKSNDLWRAFSFTLRRIYSWENLSLPPEHDTGRSAINLLSCVSYTGL
jgi:hypothetical protein